MKTYEEAARKVQDHVQRHQLSPQLASGTGIAPRDPVEEEAEALRKSLESKEDDLAKAERDLAVARRQLQEMEPLLLVTPASAPARTATPGSSPTPATGSCGSGPAAATTTATTATCPACSRG